MALGLPGAFVLLLDVCSERASEYDIQMLQVYEQRLRLAGFGNYSDGKTSSEPEGSVPAPGKVAQNFLKELNAVLSSAVDKTEAGRIIEEYNQHLVLAGFGSHYNADYFKTWLQKPPVVFREMLSEVAEKMNSRELREQQKVLEGHRASTIRVGFLAAANLLSELEMGFASEDDLRLLGDYEKRLMADMGRRKWRTRASRRIRMNEWPPPTLGIITNNFLQDLSEEVASITDIETKTIRLDEFDEKLRLAGYSDHYDAMKIQALKKEFEKDFRIASGELSLEEIEALYSSDVASSDMPNETPKSVLLEAKTQSDMPGEVSRVVPVGVKGPSGIPDAASKTVQVDVKVSSDIPGEASRVMLEEANTQSEEPDEAPRVVPEEPKALSDMSDETSRVELVESKPSSDMPDKASSVMPVEAKTAYAMLDEAISDLPDESSSNVRDEDNSSQETDESPTWKLIRLDTPPPPVRPHVLCGSEQDPEDPRVTIEVTLQETTRDNSEEKRATDAAASLVSDEATSDVTEDNASVMVKDASDVTDRNASDVTANNASDESYDDASVVTVKDASEVTGADIIEEADKYIHPEEPRGIHKVFKNTPSHIIYQDTQRLLRLLHGVHDDVNEMADENSPFHPDRSGQNPSNVPVDSTSKTAYEKPHDTLRQGVPNEPHGLSSKDPQIKCEANQRLQSEPDKREVAVDPSPIQKPHQTSSAVTVARDTNGSVTKLTNTVKKSEPSLRDPRVTYAIKHSVPVEDRYKVVARRRLPAPVDWFSSDLPPTPEFKHDYVRLYTHLSLVIRTVGFSERLNQINAQLVDAPSHMIALLRKQYDGVVVAFEKNLTDIRAERAAKGAKRRGRQQPNQEDWRRELILWLVTKRGRYPPGFSFRPLNFSDPLTCRASAIAERMKWIDTRLANGNTQQALVLLKEFDKIVASIYWRLDAPIPGEVPPDDSLPPDLDDLRRRKNRAFKDYNYCPCPQYKQILKELTSEFRRRIAIFRANQGSIRFNVLEGQA